RLAFANSAAAQSAQPGPLTHLSAEDTRNVAHEAEPFYRRRDRHGRPFGDRVSTKAPLVQPLRNKITPRQGALYSEKGEHHREQQRHLSPPYTRHREHRRASRADNPQLYKQRMEPVVRHPRAPSATSRDTDVQATLPALPRGEGRPPAPKRRTTLSRHLNGSVSRKNNLSRTQRLSGTGNGLTTDIVSWVLWGIWKARNLLTFENRAIPAHKVMTVAISSAREWSSAQLANAPKTSTTAGLVMPPMLPRPLLTCNSDASWIQATKMAGLAWVLSDSRNDQVHTGQARSLSVSSPLMAEAL
ncbi:hypothetical protein IGI04_001007, partial [Brassica rapa subsp. trilocularis]